jgi:hypothetical protein
MAQVVHLLDMVILLLHTYASGSPIIQGCVIHWTVATVATSTLSLHETIVVRFELLGME